MSRQLNTDTLDAAARDYAGNFLRPSQFSKNNPEVAIFGREWVMQNFYNIHFMDEFDYLLAKVKGHMGPDTLVEFEKEAAERFTPRSKDVLADLLAEKLAITPDGDHIPGKIGTVIVGGRNVGRRITRHGPGYANSL